MKVYISNHRPRGSATIVMMVLLSLMLVFVLANLKTLGFLKRELKLIELRQVQRLGAGTERHAVPSAPSNIETNSPANKI